MHTVRRVVISGLTLTVLALAVLLASGCGPASDEVVVYVSVDQVYAEPVLEGFERDTGIRVRAVYDTEAAKTTGLVQRLIAERDAPRADVFWSGEPVQTVRLARDGVLAAYRPDPASSAATGFSDPEGMWTGFGGRARVLLVNTEVADEVPSSLSDLLDERWAADEVGLSLPIFGTGATHAAALYATMGPEDALDFYRRVEARGVRVYDGNAAVRDAVAAGNIAWGVTDTDDALGAIERGAPVRIVVPDQGPGQPGVLIVPNTVAVVKGAPNASNAEELVRFLSSPECESELVASGWIQFPLRGLPDSAIASGPVVPMSVDLRAAYGMLERSQAELREVFVR